MARGDDVVAAAEERRRAVSGEPEAARGAEQQASPAGSGGDAAAAADASPDASPRHHKDKKHKKEKKHKHKEHKKEKRHHKEKRRHRDRSPGSDAEAEAGAAADASPAAAPADAAAEGRGGEAPEPAAAPDAAKPAAAPATAAAAGGDEDAEEGELPGEALPAGGDQGREERAERRRPSRSRSAEDREGGRRRRSRSRELRSRSRERQGRSRSPQERPLRRDTSRAAPEQQRSQQRDRSRDAGERRRSRSPPRRSRSPPRRRRSVSRSPDRRRDLSGRAALPPRVPDYRRDLDRERDRRGDYGRDRFGGPGARYDDRRRVGFEDRRRRSRSRSRDGRKRSRSEERRPHRQQQEEEEDEEEFQRRVAAALEAQQGDDEDRLIEERRRRRQEILAKHRSQQDLSTIAAAPTATELAQRPQQEVQPPAEAQQAEGDGQAAGAAGASAPPSAAGTPLRGRPASAAGEGGQAAGEDGDPEDLSDNEEAVMEQLGTTQAGALDIFRHDGPAPEGGPESAAPSEVPKSGMGEAVDTELGRRLQARVTAEPDMFAEDDIFAATPTDVKEKEAAAAAAAAQAPGPNVPPAAGARKGLLDNYDDAEGYYNFQVGELIGEPGGPQYEVYATHGKGVFSSVLRARDLSRRDHDTGAIPEVAIKVIRANETMYKAGQMERVILRKLSEADIEGKRHCIRMLGSFEYRNHLCLVFEAMDMNLRELTKRYGRGIGLSINAVRVYAQQMLVSLYHLRNCGVLHADIKPDNILVNDRRTVVKLCDFGSAMFSGDNEITPYLVSRFYRAPEVILGLPYEYPMDMWSIGCVVYELFTGRILFPGKTNNEMLKLMMDVKGPFPKKMIKKAEFAFKHFEGDTNLSFALLEEDPVTKRPVRRLISNPTVKKDFGALLAGQSPDRRKLAQLIDLLERMMQLDPDKRITPKEALRHPFIKEPPAAPRAAK